MSIFNTLTTLMSEIAEISKDTEGVELTLPFKVRNDLLLDLACRRKYDSYIGNTNDPNVTIQFNTPDGIILIKATSEETRLRDEIKNRKEHLEQLERRLKELL